MAKPAPETGDWIAFYGSLMRGLDAFAELALEDRLRFAGPCVLKGELYSRGRYPGMRRGDGRVIGELFAVLDPSAIAVLDEFEGYDPQHPRASLYLREYLPLAEPTATSAWVYVYNHVPDASDRVPSGDWRAHLAERSGTRG